MNSLSGKTAVVTGGSSGIGLALCRLLCQEGAYVWMIGRDEHRLQAAREEAVEGLPEEQQNLELHSMDVTDVGQVQDGFSEIIKHAGRIDLLINSAGVAHPGEVHDLDLAIFHWMMDVNYFGTVNCVKSVLPAMLEKRQGYIVNIASLAAVFGVYGYTAYAASKFAVRGFSDALRAELKPRGIDVSIVYPTDTETPQLEYENKYKPAATKALSNIGDSAPMTWQKPLLPGSSPGVM